MCLLKRLCLQSLFEAKTVTTVPCEREVDGLIRPLKRNELMMDLSTENPRLISEFTKQSLAIEVDGDYVIPDLRLQLLVGAGVDPEGIGSQGLNEVLGELAAK